MAGRDVLLREKCINDFPAAAHQTFLIIQHINRNDDRDQQVDDPVCDPHGDRINGRNHVCSEIAKRCDEVRNRIGDRFGDRFDVEIRELLLQVCDQLQQRTVSARDEVDEINDVVHDLRKNVDEDQNSKTEHDHVGNQDCEDLVDGFVEAEFKLL